MMTKALKQESNQTGLSIAREASQGVLPGSPIWSTLAPNSYKNFGAQYKLVARQPINSSRQLKKGVITDLDASGGGQFDLTQQALEPVIEGVIFADFRSKNDLAVAVCTSGHFTPPSGGAAFHTGDIVFGKGFTQAANNGAKLLAADGTGTSIAATGVVAETGSAGMISRVGHRFASADASISTVGGKFSFASAAVDLTTFGLNVGEWVFVGGDATNTAFVDPSSNGWGRIFSVATGLIVFDKWEKASPVDDTGTGLTIELYFGRVIKNELSSLIKHYTYQVERTLPKADTADSFQQAEYLTGTSLDELDFTFNTADKITWDLTTMAAGYQANDGSVGPKAGARPVLVEGNAYNTSSHVRRARVSLVGNANALFGFFTQGSITIKNNMTANKAIGTLGAFAQTAGNFAVAGAVTAYFVDVAAVAAVKNNSDVTLDYILTQHNQGMAMDIPLVALGDGRLNVALNQAITLPLTMDAATAVALNPNSDYTFMMVFFDYLPTLAMST